MTNPMPRNMLVLGGGSDIAVALCTSLAPLGLRTLTLAGRSGGSTATAASTLSATTGLTVHTVEFDAADVAQQSATIAKANSEYGPFDTIVVAFGQLGEPFTIDADPVVAVDLANLNYSSAVAASLISIAQLRGEPGARLIIISSIAAVRPRAGNLIYGSAKAGLDAFGVEIAAPARKVGVDVCIVRPGFVHTRMTEGLEEAPFATTAEAVAGDIIEGIKKRRAVVHSPSILGTVGLALKNLPGPVWRRVSAR